MNLNLPDQYPLNEPPVISRDTPIAQNEHGSFCNATYEGRPVMLFCFSSQANEADVAEFIRIAKSVQHEHIARFIGVYERIDGLFAIVIESTRQNLWDYVQQHGPLPDAEIIRLGKQILSALLHCVSQNVDTPVHHREVDAHNVLITEERNVKLGGFQSAHDRQRTGSSTNLDFTKSGQGGNHGRVRWQPPELFHVVCASHNSTETEQNIGHRGENSDVYSFGMVLYYMATGHNPFDGMSEDRVANHMMSGNRPALSTNIHATLKHIISLCWGQNYKLRPSFGDLNNIWCRFQTQEQFPDWSQDELMSSLEVYYPPLSDMFHGELFEYLVRNGIPKGEAMKIQRPRATGRLFLKTTREEFMYEYHITDIDTLATLERLKQITAPNKVGSRPRNHTPRSGLQMPPSAMAGSDEMDDGEPSSAAISFTSSIALIDPPVPIQLMRPEDLVCYLRTCGGFPERFLEGLELARVTGDEFCRINIEEVMDDPFFLHEEVEIELAIQGVEMICRHSSSCFA
eukprot:TRINITY_DN686_c0_g1_i6.p1 TRINITY_DN686_c0_g1~~TRINITY_DN686_c0_g1_i6.p1  ORF type:complete len:514 (-),score=93.61 TRINITY_DN686_c0_g1_i6:363-1904(-)